MAVARAIDKLSRALELIAKPTLVPDDLYEFYGIASSADPDPTLPDRFRALLAAKDDDCVLDAYADVAADLETFTVAPQWALEALKTEIERRAIERRKERGGEEDRGPIWIPHDRVEVKNTETRSYKIDPDGVHEGLRGLPGDEVAKLLEIIPAHEVPVYPLTDAQRSALQYAIMVLSRRKSVGAEAAMFELRELLATRTVPEKVAVRNTTSLLAWLKRNAGSARAKVVAAAIQFSSDVRTSIKPKAIHKRVDPLAVAPVAIAGEVAS